MSITKHILLAKTLTLKTDERLSEINSFIDENLGTNITVSLLSSHTNISKSVLYNLFHEAYGTTVKDYINENGLKSQSSCSFPQTFPSRTFRR